MNYFNTPYPGYTAPYQPSTPNIASLESQLNSLKNYVPQYQQGAPPQVGINPTNIMQRGEFVVVSDLKDVEAVAPPIDGTPVLVFVSGKNVFYNKKYEGGSVKCMPNIHSPYNNGEEQEAQVKDDVPPYVSAILERLENLEKKVSKPKKAKEEVKDET